MHKSLVSVSQFHAANTSLLERFERSVTIHDPMAFLADLEALASELVEARAGRLPMAANPSLRVDPFAPPPSSIGMVLELDDGEGSLEHRKEQLKAKLEQRIQETALEKPWKPSATDIQRGRLAILAEFNQASNLPLPEFARLAHKSRQQIYKDISARRLLALSVGPRKQRLPDWQLSEAALELTKRILSVDVDAWTAYDALSLPHDGLNGKSPVQVVSKATVEDIATMVLGGLGFHP